jgi:hypothetical protein
MIISNMIFTLPESLIRFLKPNIVLTLILKIFLILKVVMSAGQNFHPSSFCDLLDQQNHDHLDQDNLIKIFYLRYRNNL